LQNVFFLHQISDVFRRSVDSITHELALALFQLWSLRSLVSKFRPYFPPFPHFPQSVRIHNQYTRSRIVPSMLLCIVTVAIKLPRPVRQDASLFRFSWPLFIESLRNHSSSLFSSACALLLALLPKSEKHLFCFHALAHDFVELGVSPFAEKFPVLSSTCKRQNHAPGEIV